MSDLWFFFPIDKTPKDPRFCFSHHVGPIFFGLVNAILGLILLGFATFCAIVLSRYFWH
jgi:hypothetical protein